MPSIQADIQELHRQLEKGSIQKAYRTLVAAMTGFRGHFTEKFGDPAVSALYQGYLDMTYFAVFPPTLKPLDLKVAIVFNYEAFRFEIWHVARNRKLQRQYWELFQGSQWPMYKVVAPASGVDAIVEFDLSGEFDFEDLDGMTAMIDKATATFISDMDRFLIENKPGVS